MAGHVIQGFFIGGRPLRPATGAAPAVRLPVPPDTAAPRPGARPISSGGVGKPVQPRLEIGRPGPASGAHVVQRHGTGDSFEVDPVTLGLASGGGAPISQPVLAKMESAFGANFSNVRIHVGPQAARIGAVAFTIGNDIYFSPGQYHPASSQGQQLLGHELAHVVQQRQGRVRALSAGVSVVQDAALEAEADRLGTLAAAHRPLIASEIPQAAAQRQTMGTAAVHGAGRRQPAIDGKPVGVGSRFVQRQTQLKFASKNLLSKTEKIVGGLHSRNMHTHTGKTLVAYLSGYDTYQNAVGDGCTICNHYLPYMGIRDAILTKLSSMKDVEAAVNWLNGLSLPGETYYGDLWGLNKTAWNFPVGSMPTINISLKTHFFQQGYDEEELNNEVDDLIFNIANDPRNMFFAATSTGDSGGTAIDTPVALGPNSNMNVTDVKKRLAKFRTKVKGLGLAI